MNKVVVSYKEISREIDLDFSSDEVFSAFEHVVQASRGKMIIEDRNTAFNTFSIVRGFWILNIALKRIGEKQTRFTIAVDVKLEEHRKLIHVFIDKLLLLVGRRLQGETITEDAVNSLFPGCLGAFVCCILLLAVICW